MIEKLLEEFKRAAGITAVGTYGLVDKRTHGYATVEFEIMIEEARGRYWYRLRTTEYRGSGRSGRKRKSFAWPVGDPSHPRDFRVILERVLAAAEPGAEVHDPRSGPRRFFDRICGVTLVNDIPLLDEHDGPPPARLSARIWEDKFGRTVTLVEKVKGRSELWLRVPLPSVALLLQKLTKGRGT